MLDTALISAFAAPIGLMAGMALILGIIITFVNKKFHVETDPLVEEIFEELPGINCGACGFAGCEAYAEALASGDVDEVTLCTVGGESTAEEIAAKLGKAIDDYVPLIASVKCQGTSEFTSNRFAYVGINTCSSANSVQGGPGRCLNGCLGFGDCVEVCEYDAIHVKDGVATVTAENCTGCKKCVTACPKDIIRMVPKYSNLHEVRCSNPLSGAIARKQCDIGCIGCGLCVKQCPSGALSLEEKLAVLDQELCIHCGNCFEVCPQSSITNKLDYWPPKKKPKEDKKKGAA